MTLQGAWCTRFPLSPAPNGLPYGFLFLCTPASHDTRALQEQTCFDTAFAVEGLGYYWRMYGSKHIFEQPESSSHHFVIESSHQVCGCCVMVIWVSHPNS